MDTSRFDKVFPNRIKVGSSVSLPEIVTTGIHQLDSGVLKVGGLPLGRMVEVAGKFSAGKSSFCMNFVRSAQSQGLNCLWIDTEGDSYTKEWAEGIGVDTSKLMMLSVAGLSGEDIIEQIKHALILIDPPINVIVLDSLANMRSSEQIDTSIVDENMRTSMSRASLLTKFCQSLFGGFTVKNDKRIYRLNEFKTCFIVINHLKESISRYGTKLESIGGDSVKFAATVRLFFERMGYDKEDHNLARIKVHCEKNKLAPPYGRAELLFNLTTCKFEEDFRYYLDEAIDRGIIDAGGAGYYAYGDLKFRGLEGFKEKCQDKAFFDEIIGKLFSRSSM